MEEKEQMKKTLFSSESVTEGHPDKLCDQISDAILDAVIAKDPNARVAVETTATTGMVMVMGEMTTDCYVDIPRVIRDVIVDIGYDKGEYGFDGKTCAVLTAIDEQSPDIAIGVNKALEYRDGTLDDELDATGAGDQGIMFGYATRETPRAHAYGYLPCSQACQEIGRGQEIRRTALFKAGRKNPGNCGIRRQEGGPCGHGTYLSPARPGCESRTDSKGSH
jgi:S-adenosylmethionine synthetase